MEERGFATTVIGLVRYQMEQVRPPRGLWTPFQLGRPLGEPGDAAFQRRVLLQALRLLEREDGPVILEDFLDDPPGWRDQPEWQPPLQAAPGRAVEEIVQSFAAELEALEPVWRQAQRRYGRTTVGLSGQSPADWPSCAAAFFRGELPVVPPLDTPALTARFMCDDIKALYSEAAQAVGPAPASRQIDRWFWTQTVAGQLLIALRRTALASSNNALRTVGGRFFVPAPYLPPDDRAG